MCAIPTIQAGVDTATIALWLGHAGIKSTSMYIHADLAIKQRALDPHRSHRAGQGPLPRFRRAP
ncbi:MAG: hypothetical protein ACRD0E_08435 [Acidimicrobiales bacterium]